ncbi:MAG: hypothetical protein LBU06_00940 [Desulfovibrio sp.]|nr:hypothetical protein [Desulfovibrio sp.]
MRRKDFAGKIVGHERKRLFHSIAAGVKKIEKPAEAVDSIVAAATVIMEDMIRCLPQRQYFVRCGTPKGDDVIIPLMGFRKQARYVDHGNAVENGPFPQIFPIHGDNVDIYSRSGKIAVNFIRSALRPVQHKRRFSSAQPYVGSQRAFPLDDCVPVSHPILTRLDDCRMTFTIFSTSASSSRKGRRRPKQGKPILDCGAKDKGHGENRRADASKTFYCQLRIF